MTHWLGTEYTEEERQALNSGLPDGQGLGPDSLWRYSPGGHGYTESDLAATPEMLVMTIPQVFALQREVEERASAGVASDGDMCVLDQIQDALNILEERRKAKQKAYMASWRARHPGKGAEYQRRYVERNRVR